MNDTISIVVVDLIPTNEFSVPVSFMYSNGCDGCDGAGVSCLSSTCVNAIRDPSQNFGMVTCSQPGAGVFITFCPNLVATLTSSASSIASSSSTLSPAVNPSSKSATSSHAAVIGGALEEHAIDEFRVPAPPSADHNRSGAWKHNFSSSSTPQLVQPSSITPIDSGTSSQSAGLRPLPLPPQAPNFTAPAPAPALAPTPAPVAVAVAPTSQNLDRIIESLAERFGWTAPPPGADSSSSAGHHSVAPPEYS
ncbi:hypothetical protein OG21DRAFT_1488578 [Imleria badia]|nr:hypothetical protein OG21DRAFT_1488578 [Imleria badia]